MQGKPVMTNLRFVRPKSAMGSRAGFNGIATGWRKSPALRPGLVTDVCCNPKNRSRWAALLLAACLIALTPVQASSQTDTPNEAQAIAPSPAPQANNTASGTAIPLPTGANVAVIKIRGLIYGFTLHSLQQSAEQAIQGGASLIVLELDTPGGVVTSALKISKYIKSMRVPTVAWINPEAYSAGIMIAAACNQIVMAPASATGDCAPIVPGMSLSPTERAKALSPILEEFRDSARANGYDYALFHAMCVLGVQVYQIEHTQTGQQRLVNQDDYQVMVEGTAIPTVATSVSQGTGTPATQPSAINIGGTSVSAATQADCGQWKLVSKIHDGTTLLTLNQQRALDTGLAQAIVRDQTELQQFLGAASITTLHSSWVSVMAYWLTQPWVRALLMVAMLLGAYLEMQAPGVGVAGFVATAALVLLVVAPFLIGLAQLWHVVLFCIGLGLLLVEIIVIPGFGLAGVSGIICIFIGLVLMVVPTTGQGPIPLPAPEVAQRLRDSVLFTLIGIIGSTVGLYYLTKHFGSLPLFNRLILRSPVLEAGSASTHATTPPAHVSGDEVIGEGRIQVGATGQTVTELHPSGRAQIHGQIIDVISQGEWIDAGQQVRVIEVQGNRIVVEAG